MPPEINSNEQNNHEHDVHIESAALQIATIFLAIVNERAKRTRRYKKKAAQKPKESQQD